MIVTIALVMFCYTVYTKKFGTKAFVFKLMVSFFLLMVATDEVSNSYVKIFLVVLQIILMVLLFIPDRKVDK